MSPPPTGQHRPVDASALAAVQAAPCTFGDCAPFARLSAQVEHLSAEVGRQGVTLDRIEARLTAIDLAQARSAGAQEGQARVVGMARSAGPWVWRALVVLLLGLVLAMSVLLGVQARGEGTALPSSIVPLAPIPPVPDVVDAAWWL